MKLGSDLLPPCIGLPDMNMSGKPERMSKITEATSSVGMAPVVISFATSNVGATTRVGSALRAGLPTLRANPRSKG